MFLLKSGSIKQSGIPKPPLTSQTYAPAENKKAFITPRQACRLKGGSAKEESLLGKDGVKRAGMECKHEPARRGDSWGGPTTTTSSTLNKTGANTSLERHRTNILEKDDHCGVKAKPGLTSCQMERKTSKYFLPYFVYNTESEEHDILQYTLSLGCIICKEKFTKKQIGTLT